MNIRCKILTAAAVALFAGMCFAQNLTDNIVIDQFGYREQARKIAVVRSPQIGPDAPSTYTPGAEFRVVNAATGTAAHTGAPASFRSGQTDAASGDRIWHFDFTAVTTPGRYYIVDVANNVRSYTFYIGNGVYNSVLKAAVKTFYYQRAGIAKPAQYAGAEWADGMAFDQDKRTRYWYDSANVALERDLRGGWFDAGDYNKYTKWHADYITEMLLTYEETPSAFTDDFGIPESGNGIPDILDEAMFGLDWLFKMQNTDGSMLSVQGLSELRSPLPERPNDPRYVASPPSTAAGRSYYGPPNATATFGSATAFAIAARIFGERGETAYAERLRAAALKAWEWGAANPDSMFSNNVASNNSQGLAAGDQEIIDNEHTTGRLENRATAAYYLYELTGDNAYLAIVEAAMRQFPLFAWSSVMQQWRHTSQMLYIRYLENPNIGNAAFKNEIRTHMRTAIARSGDYVDGYANDGYRAFIRSYGWGSNRDKGYYGLTFYKWDIVDQSINQANFKSMAEDYLHYIHGVNPFNWVYLTNMNGYGASRSQRAFYHTWFGEGTNWCVATNPASPGPPPGFLPGGPNDGYNWDGCCPTGCGSAANNARCHLIPIPTGAPPAKSYAETNISWPINSWEITENHNYYQLSYIRLLSKFVDHSSPSSVRPGSPAMEQRVSGIRYKVLRRGIELRVNDKAEVRIFALNGAMVSKRNLKAGTHTISLSKLPKGTYIVRMTVDGQRKDLRIPLAM